MNCVKPHFLWLIIVLSLTTPAQVRKSGSIFTGTSTTQTTRPSAEAVKPDPALANVTREITYCKVGGTDLRMDAYLPTKHGPRPFPVLKITPAGAS